MKISIRNLVWLVCALALLGIQALPSYTYADEVNSPHVIGKVTYLLGQAEVTTADGSVLPLAVSMEIFDGSRIQVKESSRINLMMIDGGIEKLGPGSVFIFNKYSYDPDDPSATEIRKTLLDGEVTSTTGRGGEAAKEHYRLNSPLAAIAVLGTEYTVKVSNDETWVTVHSGEISIAKLGGSCQRFSLGACAGGEHLSEGQRGLALVVRANAPKPILLPATAIPVTENKVAAPPAKEAKDTKTSEKSEQAATSPEKPAESTNASNTATKTESESQNSTTVASTVAADERNPLDAILPDKTVSTVESTPASAVPSADTRLAVATTPTVTSAPTVMSEPKSVASSTVVASATLESTQQSLLGQVPESTGSTTTTTTNAKQSLVSSSNSVAVTPVTSPVTPTTPAVVPVPENTEITPAVATPTAITPVVVEPTPEKPKAITAVVTPPVAINPEPVVSEKSQVAAITFVIPATETVPENTKVTTVAVTPVAVPSRAELIPATPRVVTTVAVTSAAVPSRAEPVPATPRVVTTVAVTPAAVPSRAETVTVVPDPPKTVISTTAVAAPLAVISSTPVVQPVVQTKPALVVASATPTVNWGKYDPAVMVDGTTSFSEQVDSSYTQLLQQSNASLPVIGVEQKQTVLLPEQRDVGFALGSYDARVNNAGKTTAATLDNAHLTVSATRNTYDTGFTLMSPDYTGRITSTGTYSNGTLRDDGAIPQTQLNGTVGEGNNAAAYTFTHQIAPQLSADGVLNWTSP